MLLPDYPAGHLVAHLTINKKALAAVFTAVQRLNGKRGSGGELCMQIQPYRASQR
jgi:hypothetical protein